MNQETLAALIVLLTPGIVGFIKMLVRAYFPQGITTFKKLLPAIPPIIGAVMGIVANEYGYYILPELTDALTGLFLGAMGSTGYDLVKAVKK